MKVIFFSLTSRASCSQAQITTEGSPYSIRPSSISSGQLSTHQSFASSYGSPSSPSFMERPQSIHSVERRPVGPRSPSPLPPRSPRPQSYSELPSADDDMDDSFSSQHHASSSSQYPALQTPHMKRSQRQSLFSGEATPKSAIPSSMSVATPIEPLSIKKKTSLRNSALPMNSLTPTKKMYPRSSPLNRTLHRVVSPRRVSPQIRKHKVGSSSSSSIKNDDFEHLDHLAVATKEDVSPHLRTFSAKC